VGSIFPGKRLQDAASCVVTLALSACARQEIYRILRPGGRLILREPVRFSPTLNALRKLFPAPQGEISDFEHPMTREELRIVMQGFTLLAECSFRLPLVPLFTRLEVFRKQVWRIDRWLLQNFPALSYFATGKVMSLRKPSVISSRD
jgi:SAM-dependent methyltransferase